jgi:hypothetical protein
MLDIILRTCSRSESQVHGTERIYPKEEILKRCFKSLKDAMYEAGNSENMRLTVVDDHSSEEIQEMLKTSCDNFITLPDGITGNSASLHAVYDYAKENCEDLIYFVEDDYLHEKNTLLEMMNFYIIAKFKLNYRELACFPLDCNDRYKAEWIRPSFIVDGPSRYWRTIDSTTGTFMCSKAIFTKFEDLIYKFADYGVNPEVHEENTINLIWRDPEGAICFSPLPSLVYHLQLESHLPLYTNYKKLWDSLE